MRADDSQIVTSSRTKLHADVTPTVIVEQRFSDFDSFAAKLEQLASQKHVYFVCCTFDDIFVSSLPSIEWNIDNLSFMNCRFGHEGQLNLLKIITQSSLYDSLSTLDLQPITIRSCLYLSDHQIMKCNLNDA